MLPDKITLLVIICLVLAACDDAVVYSDPIKAASIVAEATAYSGQTQVAEMRAAKEATLQAAATRQASEAEIALIQKQIEGTQAAVYALQTVGAVTAQVEARAAHAASTATAWPRTATPLAATEQAIIARAQFEDARATFQPIGSLVIFIVVLVLLSWVVVTLVKALTMRYFIVNTIAGPVALTTNEFGLIQPQLLSANPPGQRDYIPAKFREIPEAVKSPGGITWTAPIIPDEERTRRNLINLVRTSIAIADEGAQQFPRWDKIPGMNAEKMTRYIHLLEQMGYVQVIPNRGTFTTRGNLGTVLYELQTQEIHLSPS